MSDPQRIGPVLVEKAAEALYASEGWTKERPWARVLAENRGSWLRDAEAVVQSVFDELGLKEERRHEGTTAARYAGATARLIAPAKEHFEQRWVSDWRLVEQGDADGD